LKGVALEGVRVLDIGAMDGLFSILAKRRGAKSVIATDRYDFSNRVAFVQRAIGTEFEYGPGLPIDHIGDHLNQRWGYARPDLTIFSGVLYHMFDPMAGLTRVRGLMPVNGLAIIETVAVVSDEASLLYNDGFWMYGPGTYFTPTTAWLGHVLPFLGLQPIDCRYFAFGYRHDRPLVRIALSCRAVEIPVLSKPEPEYATGPNAWFVEYAKLDFSEFIDVKSLARSGMSDVVYRSSTKLAPDALTTSTSFYGRSELEVDPAAYRLSLSDQF
jgi:hypothetical protein